VTQLGLAIVMQAALLGASQDQDTSYAAAHKVTTQTGRPMLILVGAKWCPACVQMKRNIVPQLRKRGSLTKVAFAEVDLDQERDLGRQLTKGGPIPQLLMYRSTKAGWRLRRVIGGQSVQKVETFISEGLALDKTTNPEGSGSETAQTETRETAVRPVSMEKDANRG